MPIISSAKMSRLCKTDDNQWTSCSWDKAFMTSDLDFTPGEAQTQSIKWHPSVYHDNHFRLCAAINLTTTQMKKYKLISKLYILA